MPRSRRIPLPLLLPALLTLAGVLLPLSYLALRAAEADVAGLREIVFRLRTAQLLLNTLLLAAAVLLGTTLLALPLAWLTARTRLPARRLVTLLCVLPLAIPGYVGAFALLAATGPGGSLAALSPLLTLPRPAGFWGAAGVLSLFTFPYLYLNLWAALRGADPAHEEAARTLGLTRAQTFVRVTLPALRPAWLAGALLITLHVLGDFSVPALLRYDTFSSAIYVQYTAAYDPVYSAWLSLLLLGVTLAALALEARLLRGLTLARTSPGTLRALPLAPLGRWALPTAALVALVVGAALAVPLGTMLYWLRGQMEPFALGGLRDASLGSLAAAGTAALTTAALALPLAYLGARYSGWWPRLATRASFLGYATPPLAFALALVFFSLRSVPALYQTFWLLILAYTLHFVAEAGGPLRSALLQASPCLEEASRTLGLTPLGTLRRVTLPLLSGGLVVSLAFVFLSVLKELPLTLLLSPSGYQTLAASVWSFSEEAQFASAAPYALLTVLAGAGLVGLLLRREQRGGQG